MIIHHRRARRLLGSLSALLLAAAFGVAYAPAAHASSPDACSQSGLTVTCSYSYTGAEQTFTVPAGIATVHVVAIGAAGATGYDTTSAGGEGAKVTADLTEQPGTTLYVEVGGTPTFDINSCGGSDCIGGYNGGGSTSPDGGGGGGASDVRTIAAGAVLSLPSRVLVAAGGGGSGSGAPYCSVNVNGGVGGSAGTAGGDGAACPDVAGGTSTGGGAGTQTAGGAGGSTSAGGGTFNANGGSLGQGGNGDDGGGGGGGLYGGGAGGSYVEAGVGSDFTSASGGGGGSSLVPAGGSVALTTSAASVTISYSVPGTAPSFTADTPPTSVTAGDSYGYTFAASGDPVPSLALANGAPSWLSIGSSSGAVKGTVPSGITSFSYSVIASNSAGDVTAGPFTVSVAAPATAPAFTADTPPTSAKAGDNYGYTFAASGTPTPSFALSAGAPSWLSIDSTSGKVSGTVPSQITTFSYSVTATNSAGHVTAGPFTVTVAVPDTTPPVSTATATHATIQRGWPTITVTADATFQNTSGTSVGSVNNLTCWDSTGVRLALDAIDTGSGVASMTYSATGAGGFATKTATALPVAFTVSARGSTTVNYAATDKGGNLEQTQQESVIVQRGLSCAAPTPAEFTIPRHGTVIISGTVVINRHSYPYHATIKY